jgi:hypothetical protein
LNEIEVAGWIVPAGRIKPLTYKAYRDSVAASSTFDRTMVATGRNSTAIGPGLSCCRYKLSWVFEKDALLVRIWSVMLSAPPSIDLGMLQLVYRMEAEISGSFGSKVVLKKHRLWQILTH